MSRKRVPAKWAVVAALGLVAALVGISLSGCWFRKQPKSTPPTQPPAVVATETTTPPSQPETSTVEETKTPDLPPVDAKTGPLHTPQPGSAERQALADAARKQLDTTSRFIVNQMYSNGAWAIAQLTPKNGGASSFVAFRHWDDGWTAYWDRRVADRDSGLKDADPRISDEVVDAVSWKGKKPPAASSGRPSNSEVASAARSIVSKSNPDVEITGTEVMGVAKDSQGRWWGWVVVKGPSNVDPLTVYLYKSGGSWKLWDYGTEPKPVPGDVDF
ncbi:MAG: hypothetical protein HY876_03920 [Coriobacteriales bacterium]|nr:hypothetical protein [Coriobacteriales bacterium]